MLGACSIPVVHLLQHPDRAPLYQLEVWAAEHSVQHLWACPPGAFNDDRVGRALDELAAAAQPIQDAVVQAALRRYPVDRSWLHGDRSCVAFTDARRQTPLVRPGHGKGQVHPRQAKFGPHVTSDFGVPVHYVLPGDAQQQPRAQALLKQLQTKLKSKQLGIVTDRGGIGYDILDAYLRSGTPFVSPLRGTAAERALAAQVPRADLTASDYRSRRKPDDAHFVCPLTLQLCRPKHPRPLAVAALLVRSRGKQATDVKPRRGRPARTLEKLDQVAGQLNRKRFVHADYVRPVLEKQIPQTKRRTHGRRTAEDELGRAIAVRCALCARPRPMGDSRSVVVWRPLPPCLQPTRMPVRAQPDNGHAGDPLQGGEVLGAFGRICTRLRIPWRPAMPSARVAVLMTLAAWVAAPLCAQTYHAQFSCPALVSLPAGDVAAPRVFLRTPGQPWVAAEFQHEGGRITISLDPAKIGAGQAELLVNPPADVDIQDFAPPRLVSLSLDGRALPAEKSVVLPPSAAAPRRLRLSVEDFQNRLDVPAFRLYLDGVRVAAEPRVAAEQPKALTLDVRLPVASWGHHSLRYVVADASPQRNALEGEVGFARVDMRNAVLKEKGTTLVADSYFATYPSLDCLQDGDTKLPGNTLPNDISWASVENDAPHWLQASFRQPRKIRQVTITWANYTREFHTSRHFEVQLPDGESWKTVYKSPAEGEPEAASTIVTFPVEKVTGFRIWQAAGAGSAARPNLMWLAEVEAR